MSENGPDVAADIVIEAGGEGRRIPMIELAGSCHAGITQGPAAHHTVEAEDQQGAQHPHDADPAPALAEQLAKRTRNAATAHAAKQGLAHQHRNPQGEAEQQKDQQKGTTAVDGSDVGKLPDCADTDGGAGGSENIAEAGGPLGLHHLNSNRGPMAGPEWRSYYGKGSAITTQLASLKYDLLARLPNKIRLFARLCQQIKTGAFLLRFWIDARLAGLVR